MIRAFIFIMALVLAPPALAGTAPRKELPPGWGARVLMAPDPAPGPAPAAPSSAPAQGDKPSAAKSSPRAKPPPSAPVMEQPPAPAKAPSRVLYVSPGHAGGDGLSAERPLGSIGAALKLARRGDEIRLAPGDYLESVRVDIPDLTISGAWNEENIPLARIVAPTEKSVPLTAGGSSVWRGVSFSARGAPVAELREFTGFFEHCLFEMGDLTAMLNIYGGRPFFMACSFVGHPGPEAAIHVEAPRGSAYQPAKKAAKNRASGPLPPGGRPAAVFVYCLFRDLEGGAVFLKNEQDLRFTNCLFVNYRYAVMRLEKIRAGISMVNTAFYLGASERLIWQRPGAPRARLENCLYAPAPDNMLVWKARPLAEQAELDCVNCVTASPRFAGGRGSLINFGIDDTANVPSWSVLAAHAGRLGQTVTIALNTDALNDAYWEAIIPLADQGHEVASHGAAHATLIAREVLQLAYYSPQASSAALTIDGDKRFIITADGKVLADIDLLAPEAPSAPLAAPEGAGAAPAGEADYGLERPRLDRPAAPITLGELARRLQEAGFRADLADLSFRNVPAMLLAPVDKRDIFFDVYAPAFIIDGEAYKRYMLAESRAAIERGLAERGVVNRSCVSLVCPYSENSPELAAAMDETGFVIARARGDAVFVPAVQSVNLHWLWSASLKDIIAYMPIRDKAEMFRLVFDFMKYHGAIIGLYSHGSHEFSIQDWDELFSLTAAEPLVRAATLTGIAEEVKRHCAPIERGLYRCPEDGGPVGGKVSFEPRPDSPLIGAGRPTPYTANFYGRPLAPGRPPNIGIF